MSDVSLGLPVRPSIGFLGRSLLPPLAVSDLFGLQRLSGLRQQLWFLTFLVAAHLGWCPAHPVLFSLPLHPAAPAARSCPARTRS